VRKLFSRTWNLSRYLIDYFKQGWKHHLLKDYLKAFLTISFFQSHRLLTNLRDIKKYNRESLVKLANTTKGLHALLPKDPRFTYSILIPLDAPTPSLLHSCLLSACKQTPPNFEILIGHTDPLPQAISAVIEELTKTYPHRIHTHLLPKDDFPLNHLVTYATNNYLLILHQDDWIRPDLLFRYEQTLRALPHPERTVLYCHENRINKHDHFVPKSDVPKPILHFPYFFEGSFSPRGCLLPKMLWKSVNGISKKNLGAEFEELILRLHTKGAIFQCIPLSLYARRTDTPPPKETSRAALLHALEDYTREQKLAWNWQPGYRPHDVRAIPDISAPHQVQVIIPYKDQKKMTLDCVKSVQKQTGVAIKITAIDNASQDTSISLELQQMGVEVLTVFEPFNYSRLNNLAIKETKTAQDCDLALFLNNDVELEADAICEMVRWINQPHIGIVGCRLHYPDGRLQHGGVALDYHLSPHAMCWDHRELFKSFEEMQHTKSLGIVDAVTAACALVNKDKFLQVGGFDEVWYPIAFSDTNLAIKLHLKGLKSFYTPYASGIHHESVTRKEGIEDFESSHWLHRLLLQHQHQLPTRYFH